MVLAKVTRQTHVIGKKVSISHLTNFGANAKATNFNSSSTDIRTGTKEGYKHWGWYTAANQAAGGGSSIQHL